MYMGTNRSIHLQNIFRLDVSVDYTEGMQMLETEQHFARVESSTLRIEAADLVNIWQQVSVRCKSQYKVCEERTA